MCSPDCYQSKVESGAVIDGKAMAPGVPQDHRLAISAGPVIQFQVRLDLDSVAKPRARNGVRQRREQGFIQAFVA